MTREQLQEAIANLEFLIINHSDPVKVANYFAELQELREQLRALDHNDAVRSAAAE